MESIIGFLVVAGVARKLLIVLRRYATPGPPGCCIGFAGPATAGVPNRIKRVWPARHIPAVSTTLAAIVVGKDSDRGNGGLARSWKRDPRLHLVRIIRCSSAYGSRRRAH